MLSEKQINQFRKEEPWFSSDSGKSFLISTSLRTEPPIRLSEHFIEQAELDTVEFPNSPALHAYLASLYFSAQEELPLEFKREVELEKLRRTGTSHLDALLEDDATFIDYLTKGLGPEVRVKIKDPESPINLDALPLGNALLGFRNQLDLDNRAKGIEYLATSLSLVTDKHPNTFRYIVHPIATKAIEVSISDFRGLHDIEILAGKYDRAKQRVNL